jgi:hypothetical protein
LRESVRWRTILIGRIPACEYCGSFGEIGAEKVRDRGAKYRQRASLAAKGRTDLDHANALDPDGESIMAISGNPTINSPKEIERLVGCASTSGRPDRYTGKRKWPRFLAEIPFEATLNPSKQDETWTVSLHNISLGGVALWSKRRLDLHERFFVRQCPIDTDTEWLPATVCHCTAGIRGFLLGATFADGAKLRELTMAPEALMAASRPTASIPSGSRSKAAAPSGAHPHAWLAAERRGQ